MPAVIERRRNWAFWSGLLFAIGALLCNGVTFLNIGGERAVPWLSVVLALGSLILVAHGLYLTLGQAGVFRRKILGFILSSVSIVLAGIAIFSFIHARALPRSAAAPQLGQKVPDFTLSDTNGRIVSFDQMFAPQAGDSPEVTPKAVLLVFYRGYW